MRTLIHLLIVALAMTASTATYARALEDGLRQAAAPSALKLASGGSGLGEATGTRPDGLQLTDSHQEIGRSGGATASGFVVLVHNTCADILVDADVIVKAMQGDSAAAGFLKVIGARGGFTGRTVGQAMGRSKVSRGEVTSFLRSNGLSFVRTNRRAGDWAAGLLGRGGLTHKSDNILIGTASSRSMALVTYGDSRTLSGAIRLGVDARILVPNNSAVARLTGLGLDPDAFFFLTGPPL